MPAAAVWAMTSRLVFGETMIRPPASRPADILGRQDRAGADQHSLAEALGQPLNALERIGRVQRHFDDPDAAFANRIADRVRLVRRDAADDRDQRALSEKLLKQVFGAQWSILFAIS